MCGSLTFCLIHGCGLRKPARFQAFPQHFFPPAGEKKVRRGYLCHLLLSGKRSPGGLNREFMLVGRNGGGGGGGNQRTAICDEVAVWSSATPRPFRARHSHVDTLYKVHCRDQEKHHREGRGVFVRYYLPPREIVYSSMLFLSQKRTLPGVKQRTHALRLKRWRWEK